MANPIKGEALVTIGEDEYTLAYNLGACAAIEGQFPGRGLQSILKDIDGEDPKMSTFMVIVWAGLKKHHDLTVDEVGEIIALDDMQAWGEGIGRAMQNGAAEAKDAARPRKAAAAR